MKRLFTGIQEVPVWTRVGIVGALTTYLAVASFTAVTLPIRGAADSPFYIDSIYQVYQGRVPASYGLEYAPVWEGSWYEDKKASSRNIVASHPPLYYVIGSILTGRFLEAGDWPKAVSVMRAFNILVGAACLLSLAWAGWKLGGGFKDSLAVSLPALAVLYIPFVRTAGDIYSEPLVVLFATIVLALTALVLKEGPNVRRLTLLVIVCALGMFTKAIFATTLLLVVFFVGAAYFIHRPGREFIKTNACKFIGFSAAVAATTVALTGWFYYRNHQASGSWFRSVEKHEYFGRPYKSLADNLANIDFYTVVPDSMFGIRPLDPIISTSKELSLVIFGLLGVGVAYVATRKFKQVWSSGLMSKQSLIFLSIVALFALQILGLYAQQLQHATGWGNINPRYFLTGLLPIGLYMAIGAVAFRPLRPYTTPVLMLAMSAMAVVYAVWFTGHSEGVSVNSQVIRLVTENGLPGVLVYVMYALMVAGASMVGLSLYKLNKAEGQTRV